jgi:hypothetical protein
MKLFSEKKSVDKNLDPKNLAEQLVFAEERFKSIQHELNSYKQSKNSTKKAQSKARQLLRKRKLLEERIARLKELISVEQKIKQVTLNLENQESNAKQLELPSNSGTPENIAIASSLATASHLADHSLPPTDIKPAAPLPDTDPTSQIKTTTFLAPLRSREGDVIVLAKKNLDSGKTNCELSMTSNLLMTNNRQLNILDMVSKAFSTEAFNNQFIIRGNFQAVKETLQAIYIAQPDYDGQIFIQLPHKNLQLAASGNKAFRNIPIIANMTEEELQSFYSKYDQLAKLPGSDWEECGEVIDDSTKSIGYR